jgi:tripartite-type tricarboxylate transporter receptor subunit TctC
VATPARLPALAQVPTMIESGFPDFIGSSWTSVMAPAGTPRDIVGKLNGAINAGINSPQMQARFRELAADARPGTPDEVAAFIANEIPRWQAMTKLVGISATNE